jgi:galacturonosyltransferase
VNDGVNGYLCKARDAQDLAVQMEKMLLLLPNQRIEMGMRGRAKMEAEFDEKFVIDKYIEALNLISHVT